MIQTVQTTKLVTTDNLESDHNDTTIQDLTQSKETVSLVSQEFTQLVRKFSPALAYFSQQKELIDMFKT